MPPSDGRYYPSMGKQPLAQLDSRTMPHSDGDFPLLDAFHTCRGGVNREIRNAQEDDELCRMTRDLVSSGKRPEFTVGSDGILFFRSRLVVPCGAVRERLLRAVTLDENLTYEEEPVQILAREVKELRNKRVPLVKVLWRNHAVEEATWETEESMRVQLDWGCVGGCFPVGLDSIRAVWAVGADQVVGPTVRGVGPVGPAVRPAALVRWAGSVGPVEWGCLNGQRVGAVGSVRQVSADPVVNGTALAGAVGPRIDSLVSTPRRPIGLLNIDGYFNNLIKFLDDAVRQNFMALNQKKLFISSFFVDELLDKLEFAKAFPGPGASYDEFANPGRLDLELHL
ncbi:unnamed protein product [Cuscuta campestris]|uniref:Uncharacterized protein n=1 Tax=Cuscuta campestris TaxID=132261 RepID=A0A484LNH3_9ASTE|nr:unnamed protein product [Cuscuta campestris]